MIRQCAWCRRVLGQIAPLEDRSVTHGLCLECHTQMLPVDESTPVSQESAPPAILSGERNP